jgi:hypothetical protein
MSDERDDSYNGGLLRPKVAAWWILALAVGIPIIGLALRLATRKS